ncbi:MAG: ATP-grasp domain-containing protein [Fimbriimonadaceae bacterium]|nr:ATP-grasp domain-containing protein [Chitinophagales bacterium]
MHQNILVTSAGRRVSLIKMFMQELHKKKPGLKVIAADSSPELSPACMRADAYYAVPTINSGKYIESLIEMCEKENIGMIIPTIDTELKILAEHKNEFKNIGTHCIISDHSFISICRDKRLTQQFFRQHEIPVPEQYKKNNLSFPVFVKPVDGSSSKNIFVAFNSEQLSESILDEEKFIFLEYLDPKQYTEFTVDMYYGCDNKVKCIIPRKRIEVRAGEVSKGVTAKNKLIEYLYNKLQYLPGVVGCINLQLFYNAISDIVFGIEINPRFGGGYPLSYHAGANFPAMLIDEYFYKKEISFTEHWEENVLMLRYDDEIIIKNYLA